MPSRPCFRDGGHASVLVIACLCMTVSLACVVGGIGAVALARRRVQQVADAIALRAVALPGDQAPIIQEMARESGVDIEDVRLDPTMPAVGVVVVDSVELPLAGAWFADVEVRARAWAVLE